MKKMFAVLLLTVLALATSGQIICTTLNMFGAAIPTTLTGTDNKSIELGVKFQSSAPGYVTGIRFYKATNSTVTHTGSIWLANGTLLATGTFTNETASGWQMMTFSTPVAIQSNTVYVASYHTTQFANSKNFFTTAQTIGQFSLPVNAGAYRYGNSSVFPNTAIATNYWADILFTPMHVATIKWDASTPALATSYNVYKQTNGGTFAPITNVSVTSFQDTSLNAGDNDCYTVTGVDASGESPQSAPVCVQVPVP